MADSFSSYVAAIEAPASDIFNIALNDSMELALAPRALNGAVSGPVRTTTVSGTTATVDIAASVAFSGRAARVYATGAAATGPVGLA